MNRTSVQDYGEYAFLGDSSSIVLSFDTTEITADRDFAGKKTQPKNCLYSLYRIFRKILFEIFIFLCFLY